MPISTTCPNCKAIFRLPDELAGKKVKCQKCAQLFVVPEGNAETVAPGSSVAPPEEAPAETAVATLRLPPPPPPLLAEVADEEPADSDGDEAPPPRKRPRPEPRRRRRDEPAKSKSAALPIVLALTGLGVLFCVVCAGAGVGFVVLTPRPQPKPFVVGGIRKDVVFKPVDKQPLDRGKFDGPKIEFKDIKEVPPVGRPGAIGVAFGPDGTFRSDNMITLQDPINPEGKRHKLFTVRLEQNKTYQIDLMSNQFDAFLYVVDPAGIVVAQDDDGGEGLNSRIFFRPTRAGVFEIEATSLGGQSLGNFSLIIRRN